MLTINLLYAEDSQDDFKFVTGKLDVYQPPGYIIKYNTTHTRSLVTTLHQLQVSQVDVILLDLNLEDSLGMETYEKIVSHIPFYTPIIVITNLQDIELALACMSKGADYICKEWLVNNPLLLHMLILHHKKTARQKYDLENLTQEKMGKLRELIHRCAFCRTRIGKDRFRIESKNKWVSIDEYFEHFGVGITDGICPECYVRVSGENDKSGTST